MVVVAVVRVRAGFAAYANIYSRPAVMAKVAGARRRERRRVLRLPRASSSHVTRPRFDISISSHATPAARRCQHLPIDRYAGRRHAGHHSAARQRVAHYYPRRHADMLPRQADECLMPDDAYCEARDVQPRCRSPSLRQHVAGVARSGGAR